MIGTATLAFAASSIAGFVAEQSMFDATDPESNAGALWIGTVPFIAGGIIAGAEIPAAFGRTTYGTSALAGALAGALIGFGAGCAKSTIDAFDAA